MRRLLTFFILVIMVSGVVSAAGKRSRVANDPPRYVPHSFNGAIVQLESAGDGRIWLIVGYRAGDGFWLEAVPLLPPETINYMRSIYDGPDPTTGYTSDDEEDKDEPDVPGVETSGGGVTIRPTGAGTDDS